RIPDRRPDAVAAAEEEDRARGARQAYRPLAGPAVQNRAGAPVPHAADAAPGRARLRRGTRILLRRVTRTAARRSGAPVGPHPAPGAARGRGCQLSLRVARLSGDRAALQLLLRRLPAGRTRDAAPARPSWRGVHLPDR